MNGGITGIIGDPAALAAAVLEDARREAASLIAAAEAEADALLAAAAEKAALEGRALAEAAAAQAERERAALLAAAPLEARRRQEERLEALLLSVRSEALSRLASEPGAGAEAAARLAAEAIKYMEGEDFSVAVRPADAAAPGLAAEMARLSGRPGARITLQPDPGLGGGAVVRALSGREVWDNGFPARLERLWPGLRLELAAEFRKEGGHGEGG